MTTWSVASGSEMHEDPLFVETAGSYAVEDPMGLTAGLGALCGLLLVRLAKLTGRTEQDILQEIGAKYADEGLE